MFSTCKKLVSVQIDVLRIRGSDGQSIPAQLVTTTEKHLADYDQFWKPQLQRANAEDSLSDWDWKQRVFVARGIAEGYAIECEQMTQGLIVLRPQGRRSVFDPSRRLVYVSRLATAPWNRSELQSPIRFKLVGSTLLKFAQFRSEVLGYGGLVGFIHCRNQRSSIVNWTCKMVVWMKNLRIFGILNGTVHAHPVWMNLRNRCEFLLD